MMADYYNPTILYRARVKMAGHAQWIAFVQSWLVNSQGEITVLHMSSISMGLFIFSSCLCFFVLTFIFFHSTKHVMSVEQ